MDRSQNSKLIRQGAPIPGTPGNRSDAKLFAEEPAKGAGERGAGHLKAIVLTLILASCVYVAFKVIPILVNEYEFQDGIQTIARFASVNRDPSDKIREAVLKEAEKDDVPVQADDIKIEGNAGNVKINVDYSVTVDLSVYQWTLNFHPEVSNASLL